MVQRDSHHPVTTWTGPGGLILDVRSREEFAVGHVKGALNVPIDELEARISECGPRQRPIAVYCRSGRRSAVAVQVLLRAGFAAVTDLGGIAVAVGAQA